MSMSPIPDLNLSFQGGDAGPAFSETAPVTVNQGGLNVPAYPRWLIDSPVDRDFDFDSVVVSDALSFDNLSDLVSEDLTYYYYAAAAIAAVILLKK